MAPSNPTSLFIGTTYVLQSYTSPGVFKGVDHPEGKVIVPFASQNLRANINLGFFSLVPPLAPFSSPKSPSK